MKNADLAKKVLLYSPILLGFFIMLPRLLSPHFGFFDDAAALSRAQEIWAGHWNLTTEAAGDRFRPLYWLYYAFMYRIFGINPLGFFIGNLVLFLILIFCLIRLALALGFNKKIAWIVGLVFALSGPVLENIYTLCKLELLQVFWILLLLSCSELYLRVKTWYWKSVFLVLMAGIAFLACSTKETGILLVPSSLVSLLIYWLWYKFNRQLDQKALKKRLILWWASLIGVIAYLIVSSIFLNRFLMSARPDNFIFKPDWLYSQIRTLGHWMLRDFLYMVPLGLGALVALFKKSNRAYLPLLLECACWMFLWAAVFIPFLYIPEYYLLPVALISAILCGLLLSLNISLLRAKYVERIIALVSLSVSALLIAFTIPSQVANARLQIAVDRANAEMLAYIVKNAPPRSTIWINIQDPNEYVTEFILWVNQISARSDLQVDYFHGQDLITAEASSQEIWIVSPYIENQFTPSLRIGIYEQNSKTWNQTLEIYLNGKGEQMDYIRYSFQILIFDPIRFFCPLMDLPSYCQVPINPFDDRIFSYGWIIDRVP